jgi:hypothetical protein
VCACVRALLLFFEEKSANQRHGARRVNGEEKKDMIVICFLSSEHCQTRVPVLRWMRKLDAHKKHIQVGCALKHMHMMLKMCPHTYIYMFCLSLAIDTVGRRKVSAS